MALLPVARGPYTISEEGLGKVGCVASQQMLLWLGMGGGKVIHVPRAKRTSVAKNHLCTTTPLTKTRESHLAAFLSPYRLEIGEHLQLR